MQSGHTLWFGSHAPLVSADVIHSSENNKQGQSNLAEGVKGLLVGPKNIPMCLSGDCELFKSLFLELLSCLLCVLLKIIAPEENPIFIFFFLNYVHWRTVRQLQ